VETFEIIDHINCFFMGGAFDTNVLEAGPGIIKYFDII